MIKKTLIIIIIFLGLTSVFAQEADEEQNSKFSINVSYFGEWITNPGFVAGVEYEILENKKGWFSLITKGEVGFYYQEQNNLTMFIDTQIGPRFTAPFGLYADLCLGLGYSHIWPVGNIYSGVDSNGNIIDENNTGDPSMMFGLSIGVGWDFGKKTKLPLRVFARGNFFGHYPVNRFIRPKLALEVGVGYRF